MTLRETILARPDLAALVAARNDAAIAAALSATRPARTGSVTRNQFAIWCGQTGMRAKIEDHAANKTSPLRDIALLCRDMLQGGPDTLDLGNPANVAMLTAWVSAGELSQVHADALIALAAVADPITVDQVSAALNRV